MMPRRFSACGASPRRCSAWRVLSLCVSVELTALLSLWWTRQLPVQVRAALLSLCMSSSCGICELWADSPIGEQ